MIRIIGIIISPYFRRLNYLCGNISASERIMLTKNRHSVGTTKLCITSGKLNLNASQSKKKLWVLHPIRKFLNGLHSKKVFIIKSFFSFQNYFAFSEQRHSLIKSFKIVIHVIWWKSTESHFCIRSCSLSYKCLKKKKKRKMDNWGKSECGCLN